MPIDFPAGPTTGQVYSYQGKSWVYSGTGWDVVTPNYTLPAPSGNAIINGAFDIWQRGTSVTHSASTDSGGTGYTADRFRAANVRDGVAWRSITVSRSTNVPTGFQYSAKVTTGANDVNRLQFEQLGEGWELLIGKPVTFSFYIRRIATTHSSTTLKIGIGGQASEVWGSFNNLSTSEFTRITRTFTAGAGFNSAGIQVITDASTTPILTTAGDLFEITGVQLEAGSVATPFKRNAPNIQAELAACQRYYYNSMGTGIVGSVRAARTRAINSDVFILDLQTPFPVSMRATPTMSWYSSFGTLSHITISGSDRALAGAGEAAFNHSGIVWVTGSLSAGADISANFIASAEL